MVENTGLKTIVESNFTMLPLVCISGGKSGQPLKNKHKTVIHKSSEACALAPTTDGEGEIKIRAFI